MKCVLLAALIALTGASTSPVDKVVTLITGLKKTVEEDGSKELRAYDKFACWCEDTLASKTADISEAKTNIESLQTLITKLGGELASLDVDIKQLKKDLAQNRESQKEATGMRKKEYNSYDEERTEGEQCIGALEAAIKVLTGAGAKKGGKFLETLQEAQLLSTLGSLRGVLGTSVVRHQVSEKDLDIVRDFINSPDDFLRPKKSGMSALQTVNNPFGDYAPQSNQIQGILKGMYDDFTGNLEKANAEEAIKQKSFEELFATKKNEEKTLAATLQRSEKSSAEKTKEHADSKSTLDDTKEQLEADQTFFAATKESCKDKAQAWAERTRLRAEELQGMSTAIAILSSDDAKKTFKAATTTFLQLEAAPKKAAYEHVQALAGKYPGGALAQIATELKLGGHFDKVIAMIENMVIKLKAEGQEDIEHRDRCENKQDTNKKAMEDLNFNIDKLKESLDRMKDQQTELKKKIVDTEKALGKSNTTITEMKALRAKEWGDFSQATKDDVNAIQLISSAIASLSKFYSSNNIKMIQTQAKPDKAPDTWEDDNYGGRKSESGGVLAILSMIKEDLENELKQGKNGDAASQLNFKNDLGALQDTMDAQMQTKADADTALAEVERQINYRGSDKSDLSKDLGGETKVKEALETDCDWIKSDFKKRADNRKLEIEGLNEAKHFLAGAVVLPPAALVKKSQTVKKSQK